MSEHYEIYGYDVFFVRWHSEYLDEDFVAVSVAKDDREVFHSGMTHLEPSEEQARKLVECCRRICEEHGGDLT